MECVNGTKPNSKANSTVSSSAPTQAANDFRLDNDDSAHAFMLFNTKPQVAKDYEIAKELWESV